MHAFSRDDIEILAPVGSYEALAAAIRAGTDAVYFGAGGLNMRSASSADFGLRDLRRIVRIASGNGVRTYLTVNSTLFDDELPAMRQLLDAARAASVSAVIVSDNAALLYAASIGLPIHLSTQLSVSNVESLRFYARWADVVVLARELNLDQVAAMHKKIVDDDIRGPSGRLVRLELFVHGALCMATSGKCYLSLHQYGSSANRGACLQACRRSYRLTDIQSGDELVVDNERLMSPKDLKTIHFLDRLVDSGVSVLKIEGRARNGEYVRETVSCYREAVESLADGSYGPEKIAAWNERLAAVFNRGFWDGYYLGQRLGEWTSAYGASSTKKRIRLGVCLNYYPKAGVASFRIEADSLRAGDEVLAVGPTTGALSLVPQELRVDDMVVDVVNGGMEVTFKVERKVRRGDALYKMVGTVKN
ncbi:MAG: collagenase-like protease [Spirochaetae bacterium HGW-Spirochaetae-3]|jgi:putative protease|nr:MAG: collagenase-like protease [Spirochaetae bacterium HGW-Spirochaetae-3]